MREILSGYRRGVLAWKELLWWEFLPTLSRCAASCQPVGAECGSGTTVVAGPRARTNGMCSSVSLSEILINSCGGYMFSHACPNKLNVLLQVRNRDALYLYFKVISFFLGSFSGACYRCVCVYFLFTVSYGLIWYEFCLLQQIVIQLKNTNCHGSDPWKTQILHN